MGFGSNVYINAPGPYIRISLYAPGFTRDSGELRRDNKPITFQAQLLGNMLDSKAQIEQKLICRILILHKGNRASATEQLRSLPRLQ